MFVKIISIIIITKFIILRVLLFTSFFMVTRNKSESFSDCCNRITFLLFHKLFCCLLKHRKYIIAHNIKSLQHSSSACFNHFIMLRNPDPLKLDASLTLNLVDEASGFIRKECNTDSTSSSTCSSAWSMNICLHFVWWFNLHDQVYIWHIKASWSHICRYKNFELSVFKSLHSYLSLILCNVTVHYFHV